MSFGLSNKAKIVLDRVIRWVFFSVALGLGPVYYAWYEGGGELSSVLARGEVFVVVSALAAAAIGELFGPDAPAQLTKGILGGTCTVILVTSTLAFASAAGFTTHPLSRHAATQRSVILFISIVLAGSAVMAVTARSTAADPANPKA